MERALSVIWGTEIQRDVFQRWKQGIQGFVLQEKTFSFYFNNRVGFQFSKEEPLALVQHSGGPCAVLSPVQVNRAMWRIRGVVMASHPPPSPPPPRHLSYRNDCSKTSNQTTLRQRIGGIALVSM